MTQMRGHLQIAFPASLAEVVDVQEYRDLSNLYRLFVLLKAIQFQGADAGVAFDLKPYERWHSSAGELPSHLPALANIIGDVEETRAATHLYYSLVCGGVSLDLGRNGPSKVEQPC